MNERELSEALDKIELEVTCLGCKGERYLPFTYKTVVGVPKGEPAKEVTEKRRCATCNGWGQVATPFGEKVLSLMQARFGLDLNNQALLRRDKERDY